MNTQDRNWVITGSLLVLAASSILLFTQNPSILSPTPLYMFLLAWAISYGSALVMPILFALQFMLFRQKSKFGISVLLACLILGVLNAWWFFASWEYGNKYQGQFHTKMVALENIIGFGFIITFSLLGYIKNKENFIKIANIGLFMLLSWCAFPYLGELP